MMKITTLGEENKILRARIDYLERETGKIVRGLLFWILGGTIWGFIWGFIGGIYFL